MMTARISIPITLITLSLKRMTPSYRLNRGRRLYGTRVRCSKRAVEYNRRVRYLVTAIVKPGQEKELARAIEDETLGTGSIAGYEYLRNMGADRKSTRLNSSHLGIS